MRMGMKRRRMRFAALAAAAAAVIYFTAVRLEPAFLTLAHESANNIVNTMLNEQISAAFSGRSSEMFYTESENTFTSDVTAINILKTDIVNGLYNDLAENGGTVIKIPLGSASGLYLLNGLGPKIPVRISPARMITADFEDSFESAGINFVKHTLYLTVSVDVDYRGFTLNERETITARIPVMESVTSGAVPDYYGGAGFVGGIASASDF